MTPHLHHHTRSTFANSEPKEANVKCKHRTWTEYYHQVHDQQDVESTLNRLDQEGWDVADPEQVGDDPVMLKYLITADRKRCSCERRAK